MTMRVLVFDDDEAIGRLVVRVATMSGMEATAVTDAEAFGTIYAAIRRRLSFWICN